MKRKIIWNKNKYNNFINEGRGSGEQSSYKPWLNIQDMPSQGRATRIYSYKTKRIHHFFSDLQLYFFYILEWSDSVVDVKEHYPLLDAHDILSNQNINIEKFTSEDGTPYIFTTTFLIDVKVGKNVQQIARTIKAKEKLNNKSSLIRLEIERRYWNCKKINWGLLTNQEIPKNFAKNIQWIYPSNDLNNGELISKEELLILINSFSRYLLKNKGKLRILINNFENGYGLNEGVGILLLKYLLWNRKILINMEEKIDLGKLFSSDLLFPGLNEEREIF